MNGWEKVVITELCSLVVDCVNRTAPLVEHETEFKMIRTSNIKNGNIDVENVRYVSADTFQIWNRRATPQINDVILTREAPHGEVGIIKTNDKIFLGQRLMLYRADGKKCDPHFLYYSFLTGYCKAQFDKYASGSTVLHIKVPDAKKFLIPLPPLSIQRRIAEILGRYDALIENYQKQISTLENMAQELYREWFVRGRCPYAEPSEDGGLPVGWRVGKLREVISYYIGGGWGNDEPDSDFQVGGFVIRGTEIPNLKKGQINPEVYRYHKTSNIESRQLKAGDIVFEVSGGSTEQPLGRNTLVTEEILSQYGDKVICASFCKQIRPDQSIISSYYLQQLFDRLLETQEMGQFEVQSTGISNFRFEDFLDYQSVILPSKPILEQYDRIVFNIHKKIGILNCQLTTLRQTRDALLPRLLSGQLKVMEMA